MANAAELCLRLDLKGDLSEIVLALTLLTVALNAYGHHWTEEELAAMERAMAICDDPRRLRLARLSDE